MGTQKESQSWEWKNQFKQGTGSGGKSTLQREAVIRTEEEVGKLTGWLPRKAAIDFIVPVP